MVFTGDRWTTGGLSLAVPVDGVRMFVALTISDVAEDARCSSRCRRRPTSP